MQNIRIVIKRRPNLIPGLDLILKPNLILGSNRISGPNLIPWPRVSPGPDGPWVGLRWALCQPPQKQGSVGTSGSAIMGIGTSDFHHQGRRDLLPQNQLRQFGVLNLWML